MKVVINIDDKLYNRIKYLEPKSNTMLDKLMRAVQNGTPLRKGHGRLIDTDALKKSLFDDSRQAFTKHQVWLMFSKYNTKVPTVLEADKEE